MLESAEKNEGLYSFLDVAHYLGVHTSTLYTWFFPSGNRTCLLDPNILKTDADGAWLSFYDFLQAYAVKRLKDVGLKPKAVRAAIIDAKEKYGLPYPLSIQSHQIYVDKRRRAEKKVYIEPPNSHLITALSGDQTHFALIVEPYIDLLEFDEEGMATRLVVYQKFFDGVRKRVVMEPGTNFGEPTVEGTPYRVETLRRAVDAEGSVEDVVRIYEVEESEVIVALRATEPGAEIKMAA